MLLYEAAKKVPCSKAGIILQRKSNAQLKKAVMFSSYYSTVRSDMKYFLILLFPFISLDEDINMRLQLVQRNNSHHKNIAV